MGAAVAVEAGRFSAVCCGSTARSTGGPSLFPSANRRRPNGGEQVNKIAFLMYGLPCA